MCGNGVRCFARFIAELENLQGRHRYIFCCFTIVLSFQACIPFQRSIALSKHYLNLPFDINISKTNDLLYIPGPELRNLFPCVVDL